MPMRLLAVLFLGFAVHPAVAGPDDEAAAILQATGVKGGLVVHLGCGDGSLTAALRASDSYLVHGLDLLAENVTKARRLLFEKGVYGKVSVDRWSGTRLPYIENLVNLVVASDPGDVPLAEILRVLRPEGVAYVRQGGEWKKTVKPRPEALDTWTHYLHDAGGNAVSHDTAIKPPRRFQWLGSPRWTRHHDNMSSISAMVASKDRLFYIFDEGLTASIALPSRWMLTARDAFNGSVLWKRKIEKWHTRIWPLKSGPATLPRRLVAVGDRVYATLGIDAPVVELDGATGKTLRTYEGSDGTEEILASGGVLFFLVNPIPGERYSPESVRASRRTQREYTWAGEPRHLMAVRRESGEVLWKHTGPVVPMGVVVDAKRAVLHDGQKLVGLDRATGQKLWESEPVPVWKSLMSWFAPTIVAYDGVILFSGGENVKPHRGGADTMTAFSAETGKTLWKATHPPSGYQSPEDILVAGGLVWTGELTSGRQNGVVTGRDPKTGEIKSQFGPDVDTYWFHHRCYKARATDTYLLTSRTGIEFIDLEKKSWEIHHWVRGGCLYGILPANGMITSPPHPCACYPEAKLYGFNALAPSASGPRIPAEGLPDPLERGPAYDTPFGEPAGADEWPTFRHDEERSAFTKTSVPAELKTSWETRLGGRLTSPVVAGGRVYVAQVDQHTLHVLNAGTGNTAWTHTAGGRIDSPPTVWKGRVIFGSADGRVTCLRETDGALIWRFRAAPMDERMMAFEQLESVWPVHGSVLVREDTAYFVAGRSMFLDDGLRFFRLDVKTGRAISESNLNDRDPETGKNLQVNIKTLQMPVALPDILSSDGKLVYMRSQTFDLSGKRLEVAPHSGDAATQGSVQAGESQHLFAPVGYLDDAYWHRAYWVFGRSFAGGHNGYYQAGKFAPAGRILAFDKKNVYGFRRKPQYYKWTTPLEHHLFASDREPPEVAQVDRRGNRAGARIQVAKSERLDPSGKPLAVEAWINAQGPEGVILARGGNARGYALVLRGGKPRFVVREGGKVGMAAGKKELLNQWVHLAGVLTADKKLLLYVNGELAGSGDAPGFIEEAPAQAMEIGADDGSAVGLYTSPLEYSGFVDEVRIFHGAVTADEIRAHVAGADQIAAANAELVLRYSFEGGQAKDLSGGKQDGKISGATDGAGKFGAGLRFRGRRSRMLQANPKYHWANDIPVHVRAMVLTEGRLFVAGPPDVMDEEEAFAKFKDPEVQKKVLEQEAALEGKRGALLWAVSTQDGTKLTEIALDIPPRLRRDGGGEGAPLRRDGGRPGHLPRRSRAEIDGRYRRA